jgi:divalent metal cation (Fe/Co/Zn/Cd) transporter
LLTTLVEVFKGVQPEVSLSGIAITAAALIVMPILAWLKRKTAKSAKNRALAADAVQSATCFYLAAITMGGLLINAAWHVHWVDFVAALAALPLLVLEGRRALRGEVCQCS